MRCAIVGAGMSGLSAGLQLQSEGWEVMLLDKGRGAGGRMATRPFAGGVFDYGAQFFTAHSSTFASWVEDMQRDGKARLWSHEMSSDSGDLETKPRFIGATDRGMRTLTKAMASELSVQTQVRIVRFVATSSGWSLQAEDGRTFSADALICTAPVPQTEALLESSDLDLTDSDQACLSRLEYAPCVAILALFDQPTQIPSPGAMSFSSHPIFSWIADNAQKGVSPIPGAVTLHGSPDWSRAYRPEQKEECLKAALEAAKPWCPGNCVDASLHFWRYSLPTTIHPEPYLSLSDMHAPLILAGDIFGGPRVEGAYLSGRAAAQNLLKTMGKAASGKG